MHFLESYYINIIKYDLINRFSYKTIKNIPKLQTIVLSFGCNTVELKKLSISLLSLQLITTKRGKLTIATQPNIILKIKKGNPVGCKVVLKKTVMYQFIYKLFLEILPGTKNKILLKKTLYPNNISYNLENIFVFKELEKNYMLFNHLKNLQITIITNTKTNRELIFLLNSFRFRVNLKKTFANVTQWESVILPRLKLRVRVSFFAFWISG